MNPKQRQNWIYDELVKAPALSYGEMFTSYLQRFTNLSRQTFTKDWNKATGRLQDYQKEVNSAKVKASINEEVKAVKIGLKTKIDRLLILQRLVDECLEQLATKQCNDTIIVDGNIKNIKRLMNQRELNDTRKTLQSLQSEISKIEGDYATIKTDITTKGEKVNNNTDLSKVPIELLKELDNFLDK